MSSGEFQYIPSMDDKSLYSSDNVRSNDPNLINENRFGEENSLKNLQVRGFTEEEDDIQDKKIKKTNYKKEFISKIKLNKIMILIVVISGLNRLFAIFGYDFIIMLDYYLSNFFRRKLYINFAFSVLISLASLYIYSIMKELYLPFLNETIIPEKMISLKKPKKSNYVIDIEVPPNSKVMYWAAKKIEGNTNPNVREAYGDYSNGGIVKANSDGKVKLYFNKGSGYEKFGKSFRPRHVHYRYILEDSAFMSKIYTVYY